MREIKFRAWDLKNDKMRDWDDVKYSWAFSVLGESDKQIWMQFTGLKDKNGKEIYEGDIFQCRSGDNKADMQGEIYFDEGCFRMKYGYQKPREGQKTDYFLSSVIENDGAKEIEVIGNIYENSELLTNK